MTVRIWRIFQQQQANTSISSNSNDGVASLQLERTLKGHTKGISDVVFSPNSKLLASASDDLTIRVWDLEFGEVIRILKGHTYHINTLGFNAKGTILASGSSDENVRLWDLMRGKCIKILSAHSDPISSIDFSFDCTIIASGSYDGLIRLFDLETGQCLKTLIYDKGGSSFPVCNVKFSPNSQYILSTSLDGALRLWDYMNNNVVKTFKNSDGLPIAEKFSTGSNFITYDGNLMVNSGDEFGDIVFWDLQTKVIKFKLNASSHQKPIINVDSLNGGKFLASVSIDGELTLWSYIQ
ncbi:unnamed protein product [Ambrosiozyma monospora]|uniref:Unnamed protein product n=1 Tax=Ambrosiozyma monospora TaxID=43982 RepID=A0ACB5T0S3_AMBMO|nr:unnamed protein product [Ambrosiozyma monospora]